MDELSRTETERRLKELALVQSKQDAELKALVGKLEELHQMNDVQVTVPSGLDKFIYGLLPESTQKELKQKKLARDIDYLKRSTLFDPVWYLAEYPDVLESGMDAATHYVLHGEPEGRQPTVAFKVDVRKIVKYREMPSAGSYFVKYLELLQETPGFIDISDIKKVAGDGNSEVLADLHDLFEGEQPGKTGGDRFNVLFIGHDASLTGAPIALFELIQQLTLTYPVNAWIALQNDGPLVEKYRRLGPVALLPDLTLRTGAFEKSARLIGDHFAKIPGPKLVLASTVDVDAFFCQHFHRERIPYFSWVHEMPDCIERHYGGRRKMDILAQNSTAVIFVSAVGYEASVARFGLKTDNLKVIPVGVRLKANEVEREEIRKRIQEELRLPAGAKLVVGCGTVEHRKGADLFVQVAKAYFDLTGDEQTHFIWVGPFPYQDYFQDIQIDIKNSGLKERIHFIGERQDSQSYFKAADAFLFTSRSEILGMVAIEAMGVKVPVIGFAGATGAADYIAKGYGSLVPYLDTKAMAQELAAYLLRQKTIKDDAEKFIAAELGISAFAENFYREFRRVLDKERAASNKKILVLSGGCPPLCGHRAEGGGLRAWGLARSLKQMLPDHEVTLAYTYKLESKISDGLYEGVFVTEWSPESLRGLVRNFSTVLMSYCMGEHSRNVAGWLDPQQQLILDCYVPIYIEICARKSGSVEKEYESLMTDIPGFNETLKRGDFFLCANTAQSDFYRGVLSALGRINPKTYNDPGLRIVPYGIDSNQPIVKTQPIKNLLGGDYEKSWKILWFGAVYPWFNIKLLIDAIGLLNQKHPTRMVMVGAKNPFNAHPDFIAKSAEVQSLVSQPGFKDLIQTHDWVPFEERGDWYLDCNLIITLNEPGMENGLSWRTRVADYVWTGMPVASNGGDPLTEDLIANGAAGRLDISSAEKLSESIRAILADESQLKSMKAQMQLYRPKLYWENIIQPLGEAIKCHNLAADRIS